MILSRKLQAAGLLGYCNADPFAAGNSGQRMALDGNGDVQVGMPGLPGMMQPQQQQQTMGTPPMTAPNIMDYSQAQSQDPNAGTSFAERMPAAGTTDDQTQQGGSSPLDQLFNSIYNTKQGGEQQPAQGQPAGASPAPPAGEQQQQQPQQSNQPLDLANLPMEQLQKIAGGIDFTKGIAQETIDKLAINPETNQPHDLVGGVMEMMSHFAQGVYSHSIAGSGKVMGNAMDGRFDQLSTNLPSMVNRHSVASALQAKGYHQSLTPVITNAANQLLQTNPNATPEEVTQTIESLVQAMGQHLSQAAQPAQEEDPSAAASIFFNQ